MNQWYRSCATCGVMMIVKGATSQLTTCSECSLGQRVGKRYAETVTLIKPGERMNNAKSPEKQLGAYDQSPYAGTGKGTGGVKDDSGKLMWNLLPWKATNGLIKVLTFGAKKYSPNGWRSVPDAQPRYLAALLRHLYAINAGEKLDPESGLRHIDHVVTNAAFLAELEE